MTTIAIIAGLAALAFALHFGLDPKWRPIALFGFMGLSVLGIAGWVLIGGLYHKGTVDRVMREGLPGIAKVKTVEGTGVLVNKRPQVRLVLDVRLDNGSNLEIDQIYTLPFPGYSIGPGQRLRVFSDKENPQVLVIAWNKAVEEPVEAERSRAERLRELDSLRDQGLLSDEEYQSQRERLLSEI